jgi:membrane dipeptidase
MKTKVALLFLLLTVAVSVPVRLAGEAQAREGQAKKPAAAETADARAARIHKQAIVVDTHIDTTQMLGREGWDFMTVHEPRGQGGRGDNSSHVDFPRMREGGLDAAFFSIYMAGTVTGPEAVKRSLVMIDNVRKLAEQHPNEIVLATTGADVRAAHKAGKIAALMGMEGGHMIDDSLSVLRDYARLGLFIEGGSFLVAAEVGCFVIRSFGDLEINLGAETWTQGPVDVAGNGRG